MTETTCYQHKFKVLRVTQLTSQHYIQINLVPLLIQMVPQFNLQLSEILWIKIRLEINFNLNNLNKLLNKTAINIINRAIVSQHRWMINSRCHLTIKDHNLLSLLLKDNSSKSTLFLINQTRTWLQISPSNIWWDLKISVPVKTLGQKNCLELITKRAKCK